MSAVSNHEGKKGRPTNRLMDTLALGELSPTAIEALRWQRSSYALSSRQKTRRQNGSLGRIWGPPLLWSSFCNKAGHIMHGAVRILQILGMGAMASLADLPLARHKSMGSF